MIMMADEYGSSGRLFIFAQACYKWLLAVPPTPTAGGRGWKGRRMRTAQEGLLTRERLVNN